MLHCTAETQIITVGSPFVNIKYLWAGGNNLSRPVPWNECVILLECFASWEKYTCVWHATVCYDMVGFPMWVSDMAGYTVCVTQIWWGKRYVGLRAPKAPFQTTSYHYDPSRLGEMYGMRKKRLRLPRKCRTMITNCHICFNTHLSSILIGLPGSSGMRAFPYIATRSIHLDRVQKVSKRCQ